METLIQTTDLVKCYLYCQWVKYDDNIYVITQCNNGLFYFILVSKYFPLLCLYIILHVVCIYMYMWICRYCRRSNTHIWSLLMPLYSVLKCTCARLYRNMKTNKSTNADNGVGWWAKLPSSHCNGSYIHNALVLFEVSKQPTSLKVWALISSSSFLTWNQILYLSA